jgi:hypothetical protein
MLRHDEPRAARNLTPRYFTQTLGAGARREINAYGRYITIVQISASTVTLSIDDDPPQVLVNGLQIDCEDRRYGRLELTNTGGVAAIVTLYVSETRIIDLRDNAVVAAMAASLANIEQELNGAAGMTILPRTNIGITGGAATQLFAANAARGIVQIQAYEGNGGYVYLGDTVGVTSVTAFGVLLPGDPWWEERYKGPVFAVGDDALEWVTGYEV